MPSTRRQFLIVCYANYCRSPVAENIFQSLYPSIKFISAGVNPFFDFDMDQRSKNFLIEKNYLNQQHIPKKIDTNMIDKSEIVLCMDMEILMILNKNFASKRNKFKLISYQSPEFKIPDPYKYEANEYNEIMLIVEKVCKNFNFS